MSLLERLKAVGEYESTGQFTLDEEKARQKLARFQLTDPRRFVLELVMAVVRLGASRLEIHSQPEFILTWDQPSFIPEVLEDLERYLLEGPCAERHLAIALNAVQQLKPHRVTLASRAGATLEVLSGRVTRGSVPGNRVRVEGLPEKLLGELAELLSRDCALSRVPITLNGQPLEKPPLWTGRHPHASRDGLTVEVGLNPTLAASQLLLVHYGVVVGRPTPSLDLPLLAVVHSPDFTLNASHSDVVQDEVWRQALKLVEETGARCLEQVVGDYQPSDPPELAFFLRSRLQPQQRGTAWWRLPLFELVDGRWATIEQLDRQRQELGMVPLCEQAVEGAPRELLLVRSGVPGVLAPLQRLFGDRVRRGEEHLLPRLQAEANRRAWEQRPLQPVLEHGRWLARDTVQGPHFRGEVGLEAQDGGTASVLSVIYQGRLLSTQTLETPLPYVAALDFSELEVRPDFSGPAQGPLYAAALESLEKAAERLYVQLTEQDLEDSLPGVREQLLVMLGSARGSRLKQFRGARLFALATGGAVSLAALEEALVRGEPLYLLPERARLPELPRAAMPAGVLLLHHPQGAAILRKALGKRLGVLSPAQLRKLQELAERLKQRKAPRLQPRPSWPIFPLEGEGISGELAVHPTLAKAQLEVLHQGVALGPPRELPAAGCVFEAIVECPRLTPQPDYQGPVCDAVWEEVLAAVEVAAGQALASLLNHPPPDRVWDRELLRLLQKDPTRLTPALEKRPLFPARPESVSLARLRAEQEARGRVLVAEAQEVELEALLSVSFVLLADELPRALLNTLLSDLRLEPCGPQIQRQQAERRFLQIKAVKAVRLPGSPVARRGLTPPLTGEVALLSGSEGAVTLYHLNRPVSGEVWLPWPLGGAVQSSDFQPRPDYRGIEPDGAWKSVRQAVEQAASGLVGQVARGDQAKKVSTLAWLELAAWEELGPEDRASLESLPFLPRVGPGRLSLAELRKLSEVPYLLRKVGPAPGHPVLLLKAAEVDLLSRLKFKLTDYSAQHRRDGVLAANHRRLRSLPRRLGPTWLQVEYAESGVRGTLGLPKTVRRQIVLLENGGPVAWYEPPLPLIGRLEGRYHLKPREGAFHEVWFEEVLGIMLLDHRTDLGREQRKRVLTAARQLYERLAESYEPCHRELMLEYLRTEWRTAPNSIARLPLFRTHQGMASLDSLLEQVQQTGELVCLEPGALPPAQDERLYPVVDSEIENELLRALCPRLSLVPRARWGEQLGASLRATGQSAAASCGQMWAVARGVIGPGLTRLDQAATRLAANVKGLFDSPTGEAQAQPEPRQPEPAPKVQKESPERRLLAALRRHFNLSVQGLARRHARPILERMRWSRYILGPPCWWDSKGHLCLNLSHKSMRYVIANQASDPAAVRMLMVYLFCVINRRLEEVTDEHEMTFLLELGTQLSQAFPAAEMSGQGMPEAARSPNP